MSTLAIIIAFAAAVLIWAVGIYNALITLRNGYKKEYAQIDVQLKRRYDLIPNLVETAKGYMAHEKGTLEAVIAARNQAASANQKVAADPGNPALMQSLNSAEGALTGVLTKFVALAESYPDLKASQTMSQLMQELSGTETMIAGSRQLYNEAATNYNTKREVFPNILVANNFGFTAAELFEITNPVEKENVKVSFN
jgi:LemA protein